LKLNSKLHLALTWALNRVQNLALKQTINQVLS
jgi:hypothetical protein